MEQISVSGFLNQVNGPALKNENHTVYLVDDNNIDVFLEHEPQSSNVVELGIMYMYNS